MDLKSIKLAQLKLKCRDLNLKEYGSKLLVFERIKKHYIDNSLGEFNLDELVELEQVEDNPVAITSSQEASTSSQVASSLNNVSIEEEEFEEESSSEPAHKKRKLSLAHRQFSLSSCDCFFFNLKFKSLKK